MNKVTKNGVTFMTFDSLKGVKHCYSTRLGGLSTGVYDSLNLNFNRGDADDIDCSLPQFSFITTFATSRLKQIKRFSQSSLK